MLSVFGGDFFIQRRVKTHLRTKEINLFLLHRVWTNLDKFEQVLLCSRKGKYETSMTLFWVRSIQGRRGILFRYLTEK